MIRDRLDAKPAVIQLPIGAESDFKGVIDLLAEKALVWSSDWARSGRRSTSPRTWRPRPRTPATS